MSGTASDTTTGVTLGSTGTGDGSSDGNSQSQTTTTTGAASNGSEQTSGSQSAWYDSFADQGVKDFAKSKNWKTPEDGVKSYKELEAAFSAKQSAPAAPKDINEYKFDVPADLPEGAYNKGFEDWFKGASLKLGASADLAKGYHAEFLGFAKQSLAAQAEAEQARIAKVAEASAQDLERTWGASGTPGFTRNLELAKRAIRMADPALMDGLKEVGAVKVVNGQLTVLNSTLVKAFAKMGGGMYSEDSLHGDPASDKNPFDEKSEDRAMQGRLIKEDPDRAALLIKAAGKERMFSQFLDRLKTAKRG